MTAVLRLAWISLTATWWQRIALIAMTSGAIAAALAALWIWQSPTNPFSFIAFGSTLSLVFLTAFIPFPASVILIRMMAASSAFQAGPGARSKLMTSLSILLLLFLPFQALVVVLPFATFDHAATGILAAFWLTVIFVYSIAMVWVAFFPKIGWLLLVASFSVATYAVAETLRHARETYPDVSLAPLSVVPPMAVALWIGFLAACLRTRRFGRFDLSAPPSGEAWSFGDRIEDLWARSSRDASTPTSRNARSRYWHQGLDRRRNGSLLYGALLAVIALSLWSLLHQHPRGDRLLAGHFLLGLAGAAMLTIALAANTTARSSRYLWLRASESRLALFIEAERQVWRSRVIATWLGFAAVFLGFSALRSDADWSVISGSLVSVGTLVLFVTYLGLMYTQGPKRLDIALWVAFLASAGASGWVLFGGDLQVELLTGIVAAQLAGAALAREVARRRWREIDWLRFKPVRIGRPLR